MASEKETHKMITLRNEYDQQIKTMKLENQVKVLELEKQVSNQETIIQKLKHDAELAEIKINQEQTDLEWRRTMAHCEREMKIVSVRSKF